MMARLLLIYLAVELTVLAVLVSTIGFGWTVLLLLATFGAGVVLAGSQARSQFIRLRSGASTRRGGQGGAADAALIALGTVLVTVPGLVTTAAGLLLLLPVTRAAARPVLGAAAVGGLGRRLPLITVATAGAQRYATRRGDFIDGEVIDVTDVEPPALSAD
ncbi:MAG TPA: FxsA family protein [Mycobacterium sp.]|nr:FxsA family protein [Mycobacterium sp.]